MAKNKQNKPLYVDWGAMVFDRDAPFNLLVFERKRGKTFGLREQMLRDYLNHGESHIAISRYKNEIHTICDGYFNDVLNKSKDAALLKRMGAYDISYQGACVKIRHKKEDGVKAEEWKTLLTVIPLSKANAIKQQNFQNVRRVAFDEALIDKQLNPYTRYLPNEYSIFQNVIGTLERYQSKRGMRVYLMGNAVDLTNPYFAALHIYEPKFGRKWINKKTWLFVYPDPKDYAPLPKDTSYAARLGERKSDYGNVFFEDSHDFIGKKPSNAKFTFGFIYRKYTFGVWADYKHSKYYINTQIPDNPGHAPIYALTTDDNKPNLLVARRANKVMQGLIDLYCLGVIRYSTPNVRERFNEVASLFGIR